MTRYVLDSYAVLAIVMNEMPAAVRVKQLLQDARHEHWISAINVGEVYYRSVKEYDQSWGRQVLPWLDSLPIEVSDTEMLAVLTAAVFKSRYSLSYADCFAVALARRLDAILVTGDPEFEPLVRDGVVRIEWLPRGRRRR